MSSSLILIPALLLTMIFSVAILRHLDTRHRVTGKAHDGYDVILQLVAMFAPFVTLITVCVTMS